MFEINTNGSEAFYNACVEAEKVCLRVSVPDHVALALTIALLLLVAHLLWRFWDFWKFRKKESKR